MTVSLSKGLGSVMGSSGAGSVGCGVQNVLNNLASFVRNFPAECHRHVIVVTFILRNKQHTNIQIEIQELEGGVKATGLFCLLGIGIGLGSLFVYKLYTRLFPKILLPPSTSAKIRRPNSSDLNCQNLAASEASPCAADKVQAETPDSGISTDTAVTGNDESNFANALSSSKAETCPEGRSVRNSSQLQRRNTVVEWLARAELAHSSELVSDTEFGFRGNPRDALKSMRSLRSSGYMSVEPGAIEGSGAGLNRLRRFANEQDPEFITLDEDVSYDDVLSIADHILVPSVTSDDLNDNLIIDDAGFAIENTPSLPFRRRKLSAGTCLSADVPRVWLRRNRHSFSSDMSAASSGCTYRESLVSKGVSIDLGEDLAGIVTPPEGDAGALDHWTMSSMDQLHRELRQIQEDIDYMNEKVEVLRSKDDGTALSVTLPREDHGHGKANLQRKFRRRSGSRSSTRSRSRSIDRELEVELESPDFMWDYHSDLALDNYNQPMFVVKRPHHTVSESCLEDRDEILAVLNSTIDRRGSSGRNSNIEAVFDDEIADKDLNSPRSTHNTDRRNSSAAKEDTHKSVSCGAGCFECPHQRHACDRPSLLSGTCLANATCAAPSCGIASDVCVSCRGEVVIIHPHRSCSGCHSHQTRRAFSARTNRKPDMSSSPSGQCSAMIYPSCECFHPHASPPLCAVNLPFVQHVLCGEGERRSSHSLTSNCMGDDRTEICSRKPELSVAKSRLEEIINGNNVRVKNIGNKIRIRDYQVQELNRSNRNPETRKGYDLVHRLWNVTGLRMVQSDNYSSLRAVIYQALIHNLPILANTNFQHCAQRLAVAVDSGHSYLAKWRFGKSPTMTDDEIVLEMTECLRTLFEQVEALAEMSSAVCREQYLLALLNYSPEVDISLLEGVKILMMLKAIQLYDDYEGQENAPSLLLQLFAKDTSRSLELFFNNHINVIGNAVPMKAAEMCLLGVTLGVRIEVIRPSRFNGEGFVAHYPDEGADHFPKLHIIEEDCDHYRIPVM